MTIDKALMVWYNKTVMSPFHTNSLPSRQPSKSAAVLSSMNNRPGYPRTHQVPRAYVSPSERRIRTQLGGSPGIQQKSVPLAESVAARRTFTASQGTSIVNRPRGLNGPRAL